MPSLTFKHGAAACLLATLASGALADDVQVAVAANFLGTMQKLAPVFERESGHKVVMVSGSTGKFYAQIKNGAPFEILLAADDETPERLDNEGAAVEGMRFTYAVGKLVLWSAQPGYVDQQALVLRKNGFQHLALANPKTAPYGAAAVATMKQLGLHEQLAPKLVQGESIAQAYQFIGSGNAELGFVALSQVWKDGKIAEGSGWIVPAKLHQPIRQDAVLLKAGSGKPGAAALLLFLRSEKAKTIIKSFGYDLQ